MQRTIVFHDPTGRRRAHLRRTLGTGAVVLAIFLVLLGLAALSSPQLPVLGLPAVQHITSFGEVPSIIRGERAAKNIPFKLRKAAKDLRYVRSASPVSRPVRAARVTKGRPIVVGYYVNWDRASLVSLRLNARHLTHLAPEWFVLKNARGDIEDESDSTVIEIARQADLPVLAMLTNFRDGWRADELHRLLNDKAARENLVDNIYSNVTEHELAGVMIDLEMARRGDRAKLVDFVAQVRDRLEPAKLMVTQAVPTEDEAYDLRRLANLCDFIVPMVYDEHYQSGTPGPVASQEWFEKQLDRLAKEAPVDKIVIGVGNYGYDWVIGARGAAEVAFNDVMAASVSNKTSVEWDNDTDNPVLRYTLGGNQHEVWFLDALTALNHIVEVADRGFRGVGVWRLGGEDPGLWHVLSHASWPTHDFDTAALAALGVQQSVNQYGEGEVIRIAETPREGRRRLWRNQDGSFAEQYLSAPTYYVMESYGKAKDKQLCITFDDGPDSRFTPAVLDILKRKDVHASFFVVGANAEAEPSLLRRMYAEGHEIGNHSYSHPNIALTSAERTRLELDATQRIIEHAVGRSTILFRPPYNADSEPQTPAEIEPVRRAQEMGYLTVGERIDPRDWQAGSTADGILQEIIDEKDNGSVILLHDAGGDRAATLEALPRVIDHFREQGYRFVTIGELLGKSRDEIMPIPANDEGRWALIEGQALDFKGLLSYLLGVAFLSVIFLTLLRSLAYAAMAMIEKRKVRRRVFDEAWQPPVSVLIAAYNEEKVIRRTVESVFANGYPQLEVLIVDDGSRDGTGTVLREAFGTDPRVTLLSQENAGKSAALNRAIAAARYDILVAVDADTIFGERTIARLVRHFASNKVGAVSGNAKVGNHHNWLTRFQSIEYIYGFNLDRRALDLVNAIPVVPGAVGAWRKSLVIQAGGFSHDTSAEDTDLTLAIRKLGYEIRYEESAVAYTEAPEDIRSLAKQRFRWSFGTMQAAWKHRDALFNYSYGSLGFVALPSIWIFQVLLGAISPLADLAMIATLFAGNWPVILLYYLAFFGVELATGFLAYYLEGDNPGDLVLLLPQRLFYRQLMNYVIGKSVLYAIQGRLIGWGKLERKATVGT